MGCLRTCKAKFKTSEIRVMLGGAEISQEVRRCEAAHPQNFCKLVAVGASVCMCVCERTSVDSEDEGFVEMEGRCQAMPLISVSTQSGAE